MGSRESACRSAQAIHSLRAWSSWAELPSRAALSLTASTYARIR